MHVQPAEAPAEVLVLLGSHLLIAKKDHQVVHECVVDFVKLLVAESLAQIHAKDLRTDGWSQLSHFYRLIRHVLSSCGAAAIRFLTFRSS
jgi:hypothetical protein